MTNNIAHDHFPSVLVKRHGKIVGNTDRPALGKSMVVYHGVDEKTVFEYQGIAMLSVDGKTMHHALCIDLTGSPPKVAASYIKSELLPEWLPAEVIG